MGRKTFRFEDGADQQRSQVQLLARIPTRRRCTTWFERITETERALHRSRARRSFRQAGRQPGDPAGADRSGITSVWWRREQFLPLLDASSRTRVSCTWRGSGRPAWPKRSARAVLPKKKRNQANEVVRSCVRVFIGLAAAQIRFIALGDAGSAASASGEISARAE